MMNHVHYSRSNLPVWTKMVLMAIISVTVVLLTVDSITNVHAFFTTHPSLSSTAVVFNNRNHVGGFVPSSNTIFPIPTFLSKGQQQQQQHPIQVMMNPFQQRPTSFTTTTRQLTQLFSVMKRIPAELEDVPIPFIDPSTLDNSKSTSSSSSSSSLKFIECYADCTCEINGIEYTVAIPCDYSVSLCYASDTDPDELIPIDVTDTKLMDDLFPIAESIVADEYGEDLVLQRTPETLTLVGELELDDDEDDEDDDDEDLAEIDNEDDDDDDEMDDDEEEVDVLLSFEHRDKEYQLVRIKDPILLVGKKNPITATDTTAMETRILLTKEESDEIMPTLEEMYLNYQKELDENDEDFVDDEEEDEKDDVVVTPTASTNEEEEKDDENEVDDDDEDEEYDVVTFYDPQASETNTLKTIDCFMEGEYVVNGVEYCIATPCDYVATICTTESDGDDDDEEEGYTPIDIYPDTTKLIDELFPLFENAVKDEFDGEMTLVRTPQFLTLVGDLDLDADDDDEEVDDDEEDLQEVEVILSIEKDGKEYTLLRELEPMLLVGKKPEKETDDVTMDMRVLLDPKESDAVVPQIMEMYNEDFDDDDDEDEDEDIVTPTAVTDDDNDDDEDEEEFDDDDVEDDIVTFYDPQAGETNTLKTIDCFIDREYVVDGVEYTIATPCDYVATICTVDEENDEELNPIDIEPDTTKTIDELFPLFADAVNDEFDGEMTLVRTPQYLTLVGDIDLDEDLDDEDDDDDEETFDDDDEEEEEEVQVILSFAKDGKEYSLVRELEPMLLVGKKPEKETDDITMDMRILLDAKESDLVVPKLMEMYNDDEDNEEE